MIRATVEVFDNNGRLERTFELNCDSMSMDCNPRYTKMSLTGFLSKEKKAEVGVRRAAQLMLGGHDGDPKCECYKEKHGFASHASWCPLKDNA